MKTLVALLRGINVGGKNTVPMTALRTELAEFGLEDIVTYIQSGNVIFRTPARSKDDIAAGIEQRIAKAYGVSVAVILRTPAELTGIVKNNPFLNGKADLSKLHVVFLDRPPAAGAVAKLDPERSPPDEFSARAREIYLHLPNGSARTKLTIDYFERRLGVRATARNWNTLLKLIALAEGR
jgi:uncharacterized protein (DUF1697 family)